MGNRFLLAARRRRWWSSRSTRARLVLLVGAVTLPLLLLSTYLGWQTLENERARIRREVTEEARERSADLESLVQSWYQTLGALALSPAVRDQQPEQVNSLFSDLVRTYPYLINVAAVDRNFTVWASAVPQLRGVAVGAAARDRLSSFMASGRPGLSDPTTLTVDQAGTQRTIVFIWQPVRDGAGQVNGLLQIGLPLDTLHTALHLESLAPGRPVLVMHVNGTVLSASPGQDGWIGQQLNDLPLGQGIHGNQGLVDYLDETGVERFAAYQKAPTLPWYAIVSLPSAEALAPLRPMAAGTILAVAAVAALALLLGRLIGAELTRPVANLVMAAERLSGGDLAYRVTVQDGGELARVGASFNKMAAELQSSYRELEERVVERTAELAETQRELELLNADLRRQVDEQVRQIERAAKLKRYLSPRLAEHLTASAEDVGRQTARRDLTVLFADIRGFTSLSEEIEPEDLIDLLNALLTAMTEVVFEHDGTLDKYLGDGLMAFFGDPVPCADHAERAVRAALEMRERLVDLQGEWAATGQMPLAMGIGIATGFVTVGTIGAPSRLEYTVIGNNVNLASRLCDQAGPGEILVNAKTLAAVGELVQSRSRGRIEIKGRKRPVLVAEILGTREVDAAAQEPIELARARERQRR